MRETYHVRAAEAWLYGRLRRAGETIELTAAEAAYPLQRGVIAREPAPAAPTKGKRRRGRHSDRDEAASRPEAAPVQPGSGEVTLTGHGPTVTDAE